ncbi:MAG: hypothetical protein WBP94_12725 [Rhodomicrobiaceae bacterium]
MLALFCAGGLILPRVFDAACQSASSTTTFIAAAEARTRRSTSTSTSSTSTSSTSTSSKSESDDSSERTSTTTTTPTTQSTETESQDDSSGSSSLGGSSGHEDSGSGSGGSDDSSHASTRGSTGLNLHGDDDNEDPPRTLVETIKRMTQPSKPKAVPAHSVQALGQNNTPRARNEILAVNLSPAGAAHARKLGFGIQGSGHMGHLGGSVTRLVPPPGMDANQARDLMQKGQPGGEFALNQRYTFYQPAREGYCGRDGPDRASPSRQRHRL